MHWRFARYGCSGQLAKQRLCEIVHRYHAFGMPLHAYDPVRVARPFDRFDYAVGSVGHDAQISARAEHGLVMRAVHAGFRRAGHLLEARACVKSDLMVRLGAFVARPGVLDFGVNFAGNILHQRAAKEDV
jgi:hypothetical protein